VDWSTHLPDDPAIMRDEKSLPAVDVTLGSVRVAMDAPPGIRIVRLGAIGDREIDGLGDVLIDCVEGGDSVSFLLPMTRAKADAFWRKAAASAARGERLVLAAEDETGAIVGTVQVVWAEPENQPHRGDVAKMLVHRRARRRGIGAALLAAEERSAVEAGKTLLVLDTASADAERLYERGGWERCGVIPDYALMPDGAPCATVIYFKTVRAAGNLLSAASTP
jgi:GNAT superfamily N-acetyltransferase